MKLLNNFRIIGQSFTNHIKFILTERLFFINTIITPFGLSILFYYIYINHSAEQIFFGIVKAGLLGLWGSNIWGASFILQGEKRLGTIDYLMAAPKPIYYILIGKSLAVALASNISILVSLFWVQVLVGPIWYYINIYILLTTSICTISFTCVGIMVGVFFINFRRPEIFNQFLTYPLYILSGIAVPITLFPKFIQYISRLIPLYWAQQSIYKLLVDNTNLKSLIFLLVVGFFYLLLGGLILKKVERRARWTGNFSKY